MLDGMRHLPLAALSGPVVAADALDLAIAEHGRAGAVTELCEFWRRAL